MDNKVKICPLLSVGDSADGSLSQCEGARCAWYVSAQRPVIDGHCAVRDLSALWHVAREVSSL